MSYAQLTIQDKNILKRWIQRRRLYDASRILQKIPKNTPIDILDFGAGNGELARVISNNFPSAKITCYEPNPTQRIVDDSQALGFKSLCGTSHHRVPGGGRPEALKKCVT